MSNTPAEKLKKLRSLDFNNADVFLWIVKRKLKSTKAIYNALNVELEDKLSEDQDDDVLTLSHNETDFPNIYSEIQKGSDNLKAEKLEDL